MNLKNLRSQIVWLPSVLIVLPIVLPAQNRKTVSTARELQAIFARPVDSVEVTLAPGEYHLTPSNIIDPTCGNCQDVNTPVHATVGLHIRGNYVKLVGPEDKSAIIHTHAGYGLYFDGCKSALVDNLSITGGVRDTAGAATDAAIVVKNSLAIIQNNRIFDNIGDSATVANVIVGIMGICGRENSQIYILKNEIIRNSWDGIAVYRAAEASIHGNIVDGVDKATGQRIGGGRGVGIGVTWNGKAMVARNLVKRYWKGIGLFVDAYGVVVMNLVEDIVTWGIQLWDADKGKPVGRIERNVIYDTGACGAAITRASEDGEPGYFKGNIITKTAQNPRYDSPDYYCYQCALALHAVPKKFVIDANLFYHNRRATPDLPDHDVPREEFLKAIQPALQWISTTTIFQQSDFLKEFGNAR
ncbi:MAG TPA: right-handed parallel beta-helix repeat-containing protein [Bacteroidota bacterium]